MILLVWISAIVMSPIPNCGLNNNYLQKQKEVYYYLWKRKHETIVMMKKQYLVIFHSSIRPEDRYIKFWGNPTENIFLAAVRYHEFLPSYRGTALHVSHTFIELRKSNYIKNPSSSSLHTCRYHFINPSDPLYQTWNATKKRHQSRISRSN